MAGLNHLEAAELADTIVALNKDGLTIVLIEHNLGEVMRICSALVVLDNGRKIGEGEPAAVMAVPEESAPPISAREARMLRLEDLLLRLRPLTAVWDLTVDVPKGLDLRVDRRQRAPASRPPSWRSPATCRVQAGRISLGGTDITRLPAHRRVLHGIGLAPEGRRLFADLTVAENLAVGGMSLAKARTPRNRDMVLEIFPRLGERISQPAGALSGGDQQMLAIGRALMAEPKLLMIDEVSLGLMPKMVDICYDAITRLKAGGHDRVSRRTKHTARAGRGRPGLRLESGRMV